MLSENRLPNIPLGVIGPQHFIPTVIEVLKGFPSFQPIVRAYANASESPNLAVELQEEVEVLLFTGPIPYLRAKEAIRFNVPAHYVPLTGAGLYRALFRLQRRSVLGTVSVDTLPPHIVERTLADLDEKAIRIIGAEQSALAEQESLVWFHLEQFRSGVCKAAITGLRSVSEALTAAGVPNEWVAPTDQDIVVALERALLSTETRRSKEAQVVLGLIHIDDYNRQTDKQISEHDVQKMRLELSRLLLDFVESLDGHLTHSAGAEYTFVTTRGIFERMTGGYKYVSLGDKAGNALGFSLSVGIGFGRSAGEAGTHARTALRQAKEAGGGICFIVREDGGLLGPLEMARPHAFQLSLLGPELLEKAERNGMSKHYLSKLAVQAAQKGKIDYLAQELASVLNVTIRSAHRCLLQWLEAGLVDIVGEERGATKGRPRQIYRLTILAPHLGSLAQQLELM